MSGNKLSSLFLPLFTYNNYTKHGSEEADSINGYRFPCAVRRKSGDRGNFSSSSSARPTKIEVEVSQEAFQLALLPFMWF